VGDVRGTTVLDEGEHFIVELFDDRNADYAVQLLHNQTIDGRRWTVSLFDVDTHGYTNLTALSDSPTKPAFRPTPASSLAPLSRPEDVFGPVALQHAKKHAPQFGSLCPDPVPSSNMINLTAIELGLEKRTTLMIRNLPIMSRDEFRTWLERFAKGHFDFFYARIDWGSGSSMSYACVFSRLSP
jgi:hypothetical protein